MTTIDVETARQKVWAKCKLTDLQYAGGPHMTTEDHVCIFRVIAEVFGSPPMGVPVEAYAGEWASRLGPNILLAGGGDMTLQFGNVAVNDFFVFLDEPFMRINLGDGWGDKPNAYNFILGQPVCVDPHWVVTSITYREIVKRFFGIIFKRVCDG